MKTFLRRFAAFLLAGLIVCSFAGCSRYDADTEEALAYIESLEAQDPATVAQILKERAHQRLLDEREARLRELESGEVSVWSLFEDYFIIGDSRAADFVMLSGLDSSRIFGQYGATCNTVPDGLPLAVEKNPAYLFLIFGLNDIRWWDTPEAFVEVYLEQLDIIHEALPDTKIFVNCIFPCTDPAFDKYSVWHRVPEYNEALRKAIEEDTDSYFVACDDLTDLSPYWRKDGVHFTSDFYELWGIRMLMAVYDAEIGLDLENE